MPDKEPWAGPLRAEGVKISDANGCIVARAWTDADAVDLARRANAEPGLRAALGKILQTLSNVEHNKAFGAMVTAYNIAANALKETSDAGEEREVSFDEFTRRGDWSDVP